MRGPHRRFRGGMGWVEAARIGFVAVGGLAAFVLAFAPRLACRFYANALAEGRDGRAGFWGFVAAGRGSRRAGGTSTRRR